jgi:hypothetical protein
MANSWYSKARELGGAGGIGWVTNTIKATLVDLNDYALAVTAATNASPIQITTGAAHGLTTGDEVTILGVTGNTAANNTAGSPRWRVTVVNTTQFTLNGSSGNGAYVSGGFVVKISNDDFIDDVPAGARVATATLTGKSNVRGVVDAADISFGNVTGDPSEAVIIWHDTGTESTSPLLLFLDTATGLPVTPSGSEIQVQWSNGDNKIAVL